jgi:phospholipid-binding lipoprotein MlaA
VCCPGGVIRQVDEKGKAMKLLHYVVTIALLGAPLSTYGAAPAVVDLLAEELAYEQAEEEGAKGSAEVYDPLESMNRFFFEVNDDLYVWVVKPVTREYRRFLPLELRESFGNFFLNLGFPVNFLNTLLQGDLRSTVIVVERFVINTTLGVGGLVDVAANEFDLGPRRADFGQTLGRWGIGEGPFIYWPLLGPSNIRDTIGLAADTFVKPLPYIYEDTLIDITVYSTERINALSLNPDLYDDMKRFSLDPYVAVRQAYSDYRRAELLQR